MRNAPEVVREVGVYDVRMAAKQQLLHLYSGLLGVAPSAVGVDFRWKVGFEDRLQHQQSCCHADPIPHARNAQRSEFGTKPPSGRRCRIRGETTNGWSGRS